MLAQDHLILEQEILQEVIIAELETTVITLHEIAQTIITIITQHAQIALHQEAKA